MTTQNNTKQSEKGANSMEITYRMQGGFQVPNLLMPQTPEVHLGKYAELRRAYLKKHRRVLYTNLKTSGKLTEHLAEIEQTAQKMVEQTVARMAQAEGVTEELKATDPMRWTGLMNNLRHSAEELALTDLIYAGQPKHPQRQEVMSFLPLSITAGIMCCWIACAPTETTSSALGGGVKSICGPAMSTRRSKKCGNCMTPSRKNRNG